VEGTVAISFDPTGTALAFIASDRAVIDPPPLPIGPLRTVDSGTGAVRTLIDGPVMAFFWSPDGRTLAAIEFIDPDDAGPGEARADERLAATGVFPVAAEPSGLAVRLVFVDVATGERRSDREVRVTELFAFQVLPFFDQYARSHRLWSSDGTALVLPIAEPGEPDRLVVLDADGGDAQPLADGSIGFWSP
jgi:TolB protein